VLAAPKQGHGVLVEIIPQPISSDKTILVSCQFERFLQLGRFPDGGRLPFAQ